MEFKGKTVGLILLLSCFCFISACAFGKFGSANMSYTDIKIPSGITPKVSSKADVFNLLGAPDAILKEGQKEIWAYKNQCGIFVLLYGKTKSKDLIIEFVGDKVDSYHLLDRGEATGIFATPGSVAK